jgi:hypothetical protein
LRAKITVRSCDEIDRVLAAHYGFTDEELDFPSSKLRAGHSMKLRAGNYDIKCRMGRGTEDKEG